MSYVMDANCMAAATAAAKGKLSGQDVVDAFNRIAAEKERLEKSGSMTGSAERMRRFAAEEGQRTKIAAAMARRHAALNAMVRDKLDTTIDGMLAAGMRPSRALLAILEGTQRNVANGRKSISAMRQAYEKRYLGSMLAEIQRDKPHLVAVLRDPQLDADIMIEMHELRKGGSPGSTGNSDAKYLAGVFAKHAELARTDLNKLGASIGKLDGWAGVQMHDDVRMIAAGKDAWVGTVAAYLDTERTFPEGLTPGEAARALGDIYDTIITGFSNKPTPASQGMRVNPANMAKALGKSRVLHFKDAKSALAYRDAFGYGNTVSGMFEHLRNSARVASNMEVLGPNPEIMFAAIADSLQRRVKASSMADAQKQKEIRALNVQAGVLRQGLDIAIGTAARPVSVTAAKIGSNIRAVQSMAKLGGAVISSLSDTITTAAAAQFRGGNFFVSFAQQIGGILQGRPKGEAAEIAAMIFEGFDGIIGQIVNPQAANDGVVGALGRTQEHFFRFTGLTWWTDVNRGMAGRMIAAEMGMRSHSAYADLPPAYRHVLGMHGIDAARWDIVRQSRLRNVNGKDYVTPDRLAELPDNAFAPLVADRIAAAKGDPARIASAIADARRDVELSVLRFVADETNYAVIKTDAKTSRWMTQGTRPGTTMGEAARFIMQFKGFPLAFTDRVVGRAFLGQRADASLGERAAHIGAILAGLTLSGYASMTLKDVIKGYWPPRDPGDPRTWIAAAQQGGAWGIYGDFLFSQTNRFGGGVLETLAGPTLGSVSDITQTALGARDFAIDVATGEEGKFSGGKALSTVLSNTPYANVFFIKPALDYLFLNSLRETLSPGYLRRQSRTRQREYGQESFMPTGPTLQGDLAR
jgi:hypothetical protein